MICFHNFSLCIEIWDGKTRCGWPFESRSITTTSALDSLWRDFECSVSALHTIFISQLVELKVNERLLSAERRARTHCCHINDIKHLKITSRCVLKLANTNILIRCCRFLNLDFFFAQTANANFFVTSRARLHHSHTRSYATRSSALNVDEN